MTFFGSRNENRRPIKRIMEKVALKVTFDVKKTRHRCSDQKEGFSVQVMINGESMRKISLDFGEFEKLEEMRFTGRSLDVNRRMCELERM